MRTTYLKFPYTLAPIYGVFSFILPLIASQPVYLSIFFLFGGALFGFIWSQKSWQWGLWLSSPMLVFLGLSILFAGQLEVFFKKDFPLLLLVVVSACFGGFLGARIKNSLASNH